MSRRIDTSGRTTLSEEQSGAKQGGKLLFTTYHGQKAALLICDGRLRAARLFPRVQSKIGAIYICKVKNAVRNLNAYFVEIGGDSREICFLSEKDAAHPFLLNRVWDGRILEGDEFPVQVVRDAAGVKQASVTTLISLANPYFALSVGDAKIGYSNKLETAQKEQIKQLLQGGEFAIPQIQMPLRGTAQRHMTAQAGSKDTGSQALPVGLVVRTRAAELLGKTNRQTQADEAVISDPQLKETEPVSEGICVSGNPLFCTQWQSLMTRWETLFQTAVHRSCYTCLSEAPPPWEAVLEELVYPYEYEEILTDDELLYQQLLAVSSIPEDKRIRFYDEAQSAQLSLTKLYGLESKMETALNRRVWLKSGGYLVIDPTEALTVIDVNTGKYESGKAAEETYYHINREAAEEIAIQLRLRNLSGMILVDFINMKSTERQEELLAYLRGLVKKDKQKTTVVDMTALGLVEITRKKGNKPLAEQVETVRRIENKTDGKYGRLGNKALENQGK